MLLISNLRLIVVDGLDCSKVPQYSQSHSRRTIQRVKHTPQRFGDNAQRQEPSTASKTDNQLKEIAYCISRGFLSGISLKLLAMGFSECSKP